MSCCCCCCFLFLTFLYEINCPLPDSCKEGQLPVMVHFTVVCLVGKHLNRSESKGELTANLAAFLLKITLLSCKLDTGLYHDKVTFSVTQNQRPDN